MTDTVPNGPGSGGAPRLVHVTTTDISLELLLGPQLSAFTEAGFEVIGVSAPGPFVDHLRDRGIRHVPLANATRAMAPHRDLLAVVELYRLFRRLRPDIVHTHNPKPGLYGRVAARAAGIPVVINTVHGLYATPDDPLPHRLLVYSLERLASVCSDAELVQNPEDLGVLRRLLRIPRAKLTLLGNGVDLSRFGRRPDHDRRRARVRAELGLDPDAVVVGAVGRLVAEKGYPELFEAWETVRRTVPGSALVVVGPEDDDKADALDPAVVERARRSGVRFLGLRDDVEDLYPAFDVYVLASHREGFPRSAMEAAASGLPIVATDIRGCRQVVEHGRTGLLVPVREPAALAEALVGLLRDDERRMRMSQAASAKAERDFDDRAVVRTTLATYERLLRAAGRPVPQPAAGP